MAKASEKKRKEKLLKDIEIADLRKSIAVSFEKVEVLFVRENEKPYMDSDSG
jgi:hypothetical protein